MELTALRAAADMSSENATIRKQHHRITVELDGNTVEIPLIKLERVVVLGRLFTTETRRAQRSQRTLLRMPSLRTGTLKLISKPSFQPPNRR